MTTIEGYLDHCYHKFLEPLVTELALGGLRKELCGMAGLYEIHGENVVLQLINERGCVTLEIYSTHDQRFSADVELLAELIDPRPEAQRKKSVRRLNLAQQVAFLKGNWEEITDLMGPARVGDTKKKLAALGLERSKVMFG